MKKVTLISALFVCSVAVKAQTIKSYFTKSVDNTVSPITDAHSSSALDDTIVALINSATTNLDMAVWDNGSTSIVAAINNAYGRGVQVRYISSTNSINSALSGLNSNIPVLKRTSTLTSNVMHNKFVVVDNAKLLMGSMNFGNGSMHDDYNNIVMINDAALAQNYVVEFNEMWGSSGAQPNTAASKFGPAKTDNTVHNFIIGTTAIQSYFSPSDGTTAQIVNAINSADYTLDIAIFTFTNNDLGDAVVAAHNRGVQVRCIMENESYIGSEYNSLVSNGITVLSHQSIPYDFHHKYCIIDAMHPASDPMVVTGSHNWTNSAENEYDENTLIIHDEVIANQYTEEFTKRFTELTIGLKEQELTESVSIYPNPGNGYFYLRCKSKNVVSVEVKDMMGRTQVKLDKLSYEEAVRVNLASGLYFVEVTSNEGKTLVKWIVE